MLSLYRDYVIKAKINGDRSILSNYIGEDNFEQLVYAVNKVESLVKKGLSDKLENNKPCIEVNEYNEIMNRVEKIYSCIESFINNFYEEKKVL